METSHGSGTGTPLVSSKIRGSSMVCPAKVVPKAGILNRLRTSAVV